MKYCVKTGVRAVSFLLCVLLLTSLLPRRAEAQQQTLQTVRVGFFAFDGYHTVDEAGVRAGYGYELLQHLAGYTDWTFEYVGYDKSWADMQSMLEKGEIDLLTSAQKTEERLQRFDFSDLPIGTSSAILTVRAGNAKYVLTDYSRWNGIRIGMLPSNSHNENLADFAAEKGFSYTPVYFDTVDAMLAALKGDGTIDAALTSNLRSIDGEWVLSEFAASPFYIMVQKGNHALLDEVNRALSLLSVDEPNLYSDLMRKYYTPDSGEEIAYTPEERAFIRSMQGKPFTAVINPDHAPFSRLENGKPTGIVNSIAEMIAERTDLPIRILEAASREEYRALLESGSADICFDARYHLNAAERLGYRLTSPYLDASIVLVHRRDTNTFSSVALLQGDHIGMEYQDYFLEEYDSIVYYDTTEALVDAVLSRNVDAACLYQRCAELAMQGDETNRLVSESRFGNDVSLAVAVSASQDPLLYSIFKKAVASIRASDIQAIDRAFTAAAKRPFSLVAYAYDYPLHLIIGIIILCAAAMLVYFSVQQASKRKRDAAQLAEEVRRNALLADALSAAESASNAKNQFLSRVSHEMRTPLNAIIGFLTLAKDADSESAAACLRNSEIAAKQLLSVINDVLDMSSIESGKLKVAHAPFDFKRLLFSVTNLFLPQCEEKGIRYDTKILTPVDEWLVGDSLRVNQILLNLLSNAVKFTAHGSVCLRVSQVDTPDNKAYLHFEVADTGCGMSRDMQERLFQPFEQENASTARKYGGSGLGMSIVKQLTAMMGGAVNVQSRQGEGTTFTVDLPFGKCEPPVTGTHSAIEARALHVLAVDDEKAAREYTADVLSRMGVRHCCTDSGEHALSELARAEAAGDPYTLCFIDWKMPDMTGYETTKRIRAKYGKDVIVIVVSAYEQHQAGENAKAAGADAFVSKPLFRSSLFDLFMTLTNGRLAKPASESLSLAAAGKRVLLAEDNRMNRMVASGLLRKFGVACDETEDGQIAADKFLASDPGYYDAILMDIQMPAMDGFEATRIIRASAHPDAATVQIIALTANAFDEDVTKALSCGMNAHVSKPIEPELLLRALQNAFAHRAGETSRG